MPPRHILTLGALTTILFTLLIALPLIAVPVTAFPIPQAHHDLGRRTHLNFAPVARAPSPSEYTYPGQIQVSC